MFTLRFLMKSDLKLLFIVYIIVAK